MTAKSDDNGSDDGRIVRYTARSGLEGPAEFPSDAVAAVILTGLPDTARLSGGFALGRGAWASRGLPRWKIMPLMLLEPPSTLPRAW